MENTEETYRQKLYYSRKTRKMKPVPPLREEIDRLASSYLDERLAQCGIGKEDIRMSLTSPINGKAVEEPIIRVPGAGAGYLSIIYTDLDGTCLSYRDPDDEQIKIYERERCLPAFEIMDRDGKAIKYRTRKGAPVMPWVPALIRFFPELEQIKNLALIEGEFKALAACAAGIPAIGLAGLYGYSPGRVNGELPKAHPLILEAFSRMPKLEHLVYVQDGDLRKTGTEAGTREAAFYAAVRNFQTAYGRTGYRLHFAHPQENMPKGIDDLLYERKDYRGDIVSAFLRLKTSLYFEFFPLKSKQDLQAVRDHIFEYAGDSESKAAAATDKNPVCDFSMRIRYHIIRGAAARFVLELTGKDGEQKLLEIPVEDCHSKDRFAPRVAAATGYFWYGTSDTLWREMQRMYQESIKAVEPETFGLQRASGDWVYANGVLSGKRFWEPNPDGICLLPGEEHVYVPNANKVQIGEYLPGELDFAGWAELFVRVYGEKGKISLAWAVCCCFYDIIQDTLGFFPMLFLQGLRGTGKTSLGESVMGLFGLKGDKMDLRRSTPKAMNAKLSQVCNAPLRFEEYKNNVREDTVNFLKNIFDGIGYYRRTLKNDNSTEQTEILRTTIITGQEVPNQDSALTERVLLLRFYEEKRTQQESLDWIQLTRHLEPKGLGLVLMEILACRKDLQDEFLVKFYQVNSALKHAHPDTKDRLLQNVSVLLTVYELTRTRLNYSFTGEDLEQALTAVLDWQIVQIQASDEVGEYWRLVYNMMNDGVEYATFEERDDAGQPTGTQTRHFAKPPTLIEGQHYRYNWERGIHCLAIRFDLVHDKYRRKFFETHHRLGLDISTMRDYLKNSDPYVLPEKQPEQAGKKYFTKKIKFGRETVNAYLFSLERIRKFWEPEEGAD